MSDTPSRGFNSRLVLATDTGSVTSAIASLSGTGTLFSTANRALDVEFIGESIGLTQNLINANGTRGTMSQHKDRTRMGPRIVDGQIVMEPSCLDLSNLLPIWFGPSGALSDAGPVSFAAAIKRDLREFYYNYGKVAVTTLRSSPGGILQMSLDCVFTDENAANSGAPYSSGTIPSLAGGSGALTAQAPLMHYDSSGAFILDPNGSTPFVAQMEDIALSINHGIKRSNFRNSITVTSLPAMGRSIDISFNLPYSSEVASASTLYPIPYGGYTGGGGGTEPGKITLTYTNGDVASKSLAISLVCVKFDRVAPRVINSRDEIMIPFRGTAFWDGTTREMTVSIDPT